jgi:hypothetical protein
MKKLDLKRDLKHLYKPSAKEVTLVDVPPMNFVTMEGVIPVGMPVDQAPDFQRAAEALYGMAYTIKFMSKLHETSPIDFTVMALEGLWWVDSEVFSLERKEDWLFRLMIMQPDHISQSFFDEARAELTRKKPEVDLEGLGYERWQEGLSIQLMHIGPYAEEQRSLDLMQAYLDEHGYQYRGQHHEIYLGDPRRAKPENLKTVLRHGVEKIK